ncbi:hypothetical protein FACS189411_05860 [Bacteroidia bacterium]|nr:hypothetical protein FACS189411_05860 [Bacteroidia bacterium]
MNNGFKVEWSEEALQNFNYTIQYLQENWSEREIARFVQDVNKGIARIAKFPLANPRTYQNAAVRRYIMTKIHTMYLSA